MRPYLLPLALLPLSLALVLRLLVLEPRLAEERFEIDLQPVAVSEAGELARFFDHMGYQWPPGPTVPALDVHRLPGDMERLDTTARKALFFRMMLPLVVAENERIRLQRRWLEENLSRDNLPDSVRFRIGELAAAYGVEDELDRASGRRRLLRRVDAIPTALVLAQAANESGWGTSRFAREANNLFGVWTWDASKGLVPLERSAGARHFVRVYPDLRASVRSYLHNINTGHAYGDLRGMRERLRAEGRSPDSLTLAEALVRYSERGVEYVRELQAMIRYNDLTTVEEVTLAPR